MANVNLAYQIIPKFIVNFIRRSKMAEIIIGLMIGWDIAVVIAIIICLIILAIIR
jgi:hypothetical protein